MREGSAEEATGEEQNDEQRHRRDGERRKLAAFGERLRLARLRRRITATNAATRVGVSRATIHRMENGDPNSTIGNYFRLLGILSLQDDFDHVARDDEWGRALQDLRLPAKRKRTPPNPDETL